MSIPDERTKFHEFFTLKLRAALVNVGIDIVLPALDKVWEAKDVPAVEAYSGSRDEVHLGFFFLSHLGDSLVASSLPRLLHENGYKRVIATPHRSTYVIYKNNPYVDGYASQGGVSLGPKSHAAAGLGNHFNRIERHFGLPMRLFPRGEVYLSPDEVTWAQKFRAGLPQDKPILMLSPNVVSHVENDLVQRWPWQAIVDVLRARFTVVYPIPKLDQYKKDSAILERDSSKWDVVPLQGCETPEGLDARQYMSLFSVCDAFFGSHAGGSHVAAAFQLPSVVCMPKRYCLEFPAAPNCDDWMRWRYPQHAFAMKI